MGADPEWEIRRALRPGESLLWVGRPDPSVTFSPADAYLIPFGVMFFGFSIFWEAGAAGGGAFFLLWGIPFIGMGAYMTFGRFWFKRRRKLRTAYGVTTERAIIAVGTSQLAEIPIKQQQVSINKSRDGRHGTMQFGATGGGWRAGPSYANTGMEFFDRGSGGVGFYDVADFTALQRAVDEAQRP